MKYVKHKTEIVNLSKVYTIKKNLASKDPHTLFMFEKNHSNSFYFNNEKDCDLAYEKIANFLQNKNETFLEL